MALKTTIATSICALVLMGTVAAQADTYRPGEFLAARSQSGRAVA